MCDEFKKIELRVVKIISGKLVGDFDERALLLSEIMGLNYNTTSDLLAGVEDELAVFDIDHLFKFVKYYDMKPWEIFGETNLECENEYAVQIRDEVFNFIKSKHMSIAEVEDAVGWKMDEFFSSTEIVEYLSYIIKSPILFFCNLCEWMHKDFIQFFCSSYILCQKYELID